MEGGGDTTGRRSQNHHYLRKRTNDDGETEREREARERERDKHKFQVRWRLRLQISRYQSAETEGGYTVHTAKKGAETMVQKMNQDRIELANT